MQGAARKKLVMVGNGMAGVRTLEELLALAPDQYDITVFGAEPYGNYNRIMLSPVLANEMTIDDIITHDFDWYRERGIRLLAGRTVVEIDRHRQRVIADDGTVVEYDRLLMATGSTPFILPVPGNDLEGVISYRDIHDVNTMMETAQRFKKAVVIGGGLLGLEAANGLKNQGMDVTVVHISKTLMERQLDAVAGGLLQTYLEDQGIQFAMEAFTAEIKGRDRVETVCFKDGREVEADLVVMAAGIVPNVAVAKQAGLPCERGVLVNDTLQTYDPKIYAVGECAQHRGIAYGLVAPLFDQGKVCANHLAEHGIARYEGTVLSTKLKVTGVKLFSAGDFSGGDGCDELIYKDISQGVYKKLVIKDDRLVGAVLYGDTQDGPWYFELIQSAGSVASLRQDLIFGREFAQEENATENIAEAA
ncbi:nitrite reductase (NAD(P)H), large subunit [gamma proteobacterium HTCC5015]|nr:nitrite reductase (NAD(P)H), large subunit [gamma proteobacterium HTCC5015]